MSDVVMNDFEFGNGGGPPAGIYVATFEGIKSTNHEQWGPGAQFSMKVAAGQHTGAVSSRTGKPQPTGKNITGKLILGLLGRAIAPGEKVNLSACVGKKYRIVVEATKDGESTRLGAILPLDE
jgi:hypothetical protein